MIVRLGFVRMANDLKGGSEMTYEEALKEAKEKAKGLPTFMKDGREWIKVNGQSFPKDWFLGHCARMRVSGEI